MNPRETGLLRWYGFIQKIFPMGVVLLLALLTFLVKVAPVLAAATKIDDAGDPGAMPAAGRQVVRTSAGTLYAFINDGGSCEIWKSTSGSSWSEQDAADNPACNTTENVAMAIDANNDLHLIYEDDATAIINYITFDTPTDQFGTEETITGMDTPTDMAIAIDSNNIPHVAAYTVITNPAVEYTNRVGGSWDATPVQLETQAGNTFFGVSITVSEDNIPEISYINSTDDDLTAAVGDVNDAASFTLQDVDTTVNDTAGQRGSSIGIDSSGNTYIGYIDSGAGNGNLAKHNDADAWSTWTIIATNTNVGREPSLAIDSTTVYLFYEEDNDDIAFNVYTGSWAGEVILETGTYQDVKAKWSYLNNNQGSTQIDYLFSDGTDVYWNFRNLTNPAFEKHINITDQEFYTASTTDVPTDNSLGLVRWNGASYAGASVYFEAVLDYPNTVATLYDSDGNAVSGSEVSSTPSCTGSCRLRSGALSLTDGTKYTVRIKTSSSVGNALNTIKSARLVILQTEVTAISKTEEQVELGLAEGNTSGSYTTLANPKLYYHDATKFTPTPAAYFDATLRANTPKLEQQINIIDQTVTTTSTTDTPTDNSLGLIRWTAGSYTGATVYFEALMRQNTSGTVTATLYTAGGSAVTDSSVSQAARSGDAPQQNYLVRSPAISLTDGTDYTVRFKSSNGNTAQVKAARLIIAQSDATKIDDTETQVELGNAQNDFANTTYSTLTDPKIYLYDTDKFSGTETIHFEATLHTDNGADTVSAQLLRCTSASDCSSGTAVTGSEITHTGNTNWTRVRTSTAITANMTDDANYAVQVKTSAGTADIANAKIIIIQDGGGSGLTDVEVVQEQINTLATSTATSYSTGQYALNIFDQTEFGVQPVIYHEVTMKTSAGTAYINMGISNDTGSGTTIGSELTTTSTTYSRVRATADLAGKIYSAKGYEFNQQLKNSSGINTTSIALSRLVIQVSGLPTSGATGFAQLYDNTAGQAVTNSQITADTSGSFTHIRAGPLTLTSTQAEYVVQLKSAILANAKLVLIQSSNVTKTEIIHQHVSSLGFVNVDQDTDMQYVPSNFAGGTFTYFHEATLYNSGGTTSVLLRNKTSSTTINTQSASNTAYVRSRSSDITASMPTAVRTLGTTIGCTGSCLVANSYLIIQVGDLPVSNANPNTPTALGPSNQVDGSWGNDSTPTLEFTLSDSDTSDTLQFRIQIDDSSDFSSVLVDYTSALAAQGSRTFTVGQAAGSGTYTTGSSGQTLSDSSFYWRVKAIDNSSAESSYATANSGSIAFKVDTTPPANIELQAPCDKCYTSNERPTFRWKGSSDTGSGLASYVLEADNGDTGDWSISGLSTSGTTQATATTYIQRFEGFTDSSTSNDYLEVYTLSSANWSSGSNDGKLKEGKRTWVVRARDQAGNETSASWTLYVDRSGPATSIDTIDEVVVDSNSETVENRLPLFVGTVTDNLSGDATDRRVASGPTEVEIKFERIRIQRRQTTYDLYSVATVTIPTTYWTSDGTKITDNTVNTSGKYAPYSYRPSRNLPPDTYRLTVTGKDNVGNTSSTSITLIVTQTSDITKIFNVRAINIATNSALIVWTTNHPATSKVNYGLTPDYGLDVSSDLRVRDHALQLFNLIPDTLYYYEVMSQGRTYAFDARHEFNTLAMGGVAAEPSPTPEAGELPLASLLPGGIASDIGELIGGIGGAIGEIVGAIEDAIKTVIDTIADLITTIVTAISETVETIGTTLNENPITEAAGDLASTITAVGMVTVSTAVVVSAALTAVGLAVAASHSVSTTTTVTATGVQMSRFHAFMKGLSQGISHVLTNLLTALGLIKRKRRTVGIVFDAATRQPIPEAYVVFYSSSGNLRSVVTNNEGRFSLTAPPDTYTVRVEKPGYVFPSTIITVPANDLFARIYRQGEPIEIKGEPIANLAIPLDPTPERVNLAIRLLSKARNTVTYIIVTLALPLVLASLLVVIYANLTNPSLINRLALIVTTGSLIYYLNSLIAKGRHWGTVTTTDGKPAPGLTLELYQELPGRTDLFAITQTDREGRYLFTPDNGVYTLKVYDRDHTLLTEKFHLTVNEDRPLVNEKVVVEV